MQIVLFFLILLSIQLAFLPGLLTQGEKVSNPHRTIVVGGSASDAPYEFLDNDSEPEGYNVDLTRAIATETGLDVKIKLTEMSQAKTDLMAGRIDLIQGVMASFARTNGLLFAAHSLVRQQLFSLDTGRPPINSPPDLAGARVLVKENGISHRFLVEQNIQADITTVKTRAQALSLLASGRFDYALLATISDRSIRRQLTFISRLKGTKKILTAGELSPPLSYGFAATPKNKELMDKFSSGFLSLKKKGLWQEIHDQWLGPDQSAGKNSLRLKIGSFIFTPLIFLILTVVLWNRSLKREVERRSRELALSHQQLIQADKMTSLGTLVSGVAHEINNPTGLILYNLSVMEKIWQAAAQTLEERYRETGDFFIGGMKYSLVREDVHAVFGEVKNGATRIKQIVDDLKDFARKDAEKPKEAVDLNQVLANALRLIKNKEAQDRLMVSYGSGIPRFTGSCQRIEQVIINLILNAGQALTGPDQKVHVKTWYDPRDQKILLEVRDEGKGIPADQLDYLTDPFYTTRRAQGGTGLGLSVSAGIMADHKGSLTFDSTPGKGTTATMHLNVDDRR